MPFLSSLRNAIDIDEVCCDNCFVAVLISRPMFFLASTSSFFSHWGHSKSTCALKRGRGALQRTYVHSCNFQTVITCKAP